MAGRPPKERPTHILTIGGALTDQQCAVLRSRLSAIPAVAGLSAELQDGLVNEVIQSLPFYAVTKQARIDSMVKLSGAVRGNKPNTHTVNLLNDCARAWAKASGLNGSLWSTDARNSPAVDIACAAIATAEDKPHYSQALRRQLRAAHKARRR